MKKRTRGIGLAISLFLVGFFFVPGFRSEVIMRPVSFMADRDSLMAQKGFSITLPDGSDTPDKDWTSSMKIFQARAFESAKPPIWATILYNFGAFSGGRSTFYDPDSPYEMAFYGAYAVARQGEEAFGFEADGRVDLEDMSLIPLYDLEVLVLGGLGCPKEMASAVIVSLEATEGSGEGLAEEGPSLADWTRLDVEVDTRSPIHARDGWNQNDLQYGPPPKEVDQPFPPLRLKGRIYAKAFPEWESSIFLYVFAKDWALIDKTDREFLQNVQIEER